MFFFLSLLLYFPFKRKDKNIAAIRNFKFCVGAVIQSSIISFVPTFLFAGVLLLFFFFPFKQLSAFHELVLPLLGSLIAKVDWVCPFM